MIDTIEKENIILKNQIKQNKSDIINLNNKIQKDQIIIKKLQYEIQEKEMIIINKQIQKINFGNTQLENQSNQISYIQTPTINNQLQIIKDHYEQNKKNII